MHIATFSAISVNQTGGQCVKIFIPLSCLYGNHQPRQILYSIKSAWSWSEDSGQAAMCPIKHIYPWLCLFLKNSLAVRHANNRDRFKPHRFIRHPGPCYLNSDGVPRSCVAEMGTNVFVCVRNRETQKRRPKESRGAEKRRGERERGRWGKRGNVVAACQLLIRALVCPLWVGVRD